MNSNKVETKTQRRRRNDRPVDPEIAKRNAVTVDLFRRPTGPFPDKLPPPSHPAKNLTKPVDEPLWLDADCIDGEYGLIAAKATQEFHPDAAGYQTLVEEEYRAKSDVERSFSKKIE